MNGLTFQLQSGIHKRALTIDSPEISLRDLRAEAYKFIKDTVLHVAMGMMEVYRTTPSVIAFKCDEAVLCRGYKALYFVFMRKSSRAFTKDYSNSRATWKTVFAILIVV
ncbi:hypothetical protein GCK32_019020 [Trichostrongylus colubriformis]|uniref:Serine/threonine-protein kinase D1-3-like ubiquitin-like domain-containing protein n=1 Tax=Trichostrongylus colubriformis TaxID=6319 RepID=A0AAN8FYM2_TRICO